MYPLSTSLLFKCSLAVQYLFKSIYEYSLAFSFRNDKLYRIFKEKEENLPTYYSFKSYNNIILENSDDIFKYFSDKTSSKHLRRIGRSYETGSKFLKP